MQRFVKWCLERSAVVVLLTVMLLVAGAFGATQLRQQFFPDIEFPLVMATIDVPGTDAGTVDEDVARPLARAAESIDSSGRIVTVAQEGAARVYVQLDYGTDTAGAREEILDAMREVDLPEAAGDIRVEGGFSDQAVVVASLTSSKGEEALRRVATDVERDLEDVEGVSKVEVSGGNEPRYLVEPTRAAIESGMSAPVLAGLVRDAMSSQPAGAVIDDGERVPLVVEGAGIGSIGELRRLKIGGGRTLADVATVRQGAEETGGFAITNGKPSISVSVYRRSSANEVEVVDGAMEVLDEAEKRLGKDSLTTIFETGSEIRASIHGLLIEASLGALLAVIVIFLFLRSLRGTLVAAIAIPTSLVFGVLVAWQLGLTLNIITLAGLTIAIGRVIDDAIVVLENIHKHLERGEPRTQAVVQGTSEVAAAISSSTLATAAVFVPLGVVGGLISELFLSFSIVVAVALLASFLVAITIIPVLCGIFLRASGESQGDHAPGATLARAVTPATRFGITHRWVSIGAALATFAATIAVVAAGAIPVQFMPDTGTQQVFGMVNLQPGTTAPQARKHLAALRSEIEGIKGLDEYQIAWGEAGFFADPMQTVDSATFFLTLEDDVDAEKVVASLRRAGEREYPGDFSVQRVEKGPPAGSFEATVTATSHEEVAAAADRIEKLLATRDDAVEVQNGAASSQEQIIVKLERDAAGRATASAVSQQLAGVAMSIDAGEAGDGVPINVRVAPDLASDLKLLRRLPVGSTTTSVPVSGASAMAGMGGGAPGGAGAGGQGVGPAGTGMTTLTTPVRLGSVATVSRVSQPAFINRVDGELAATVSARLLGKDTAKAIREIRGDIDDLELGSAKLDYEGEASFINDMFRDLGLAMVTAIAVVYLVLVLFFGSTVHPLTILTPILFSTIGSMLALAITGQALGLPAMIGQLLLIGIVVANSILLVDTALRLRRSGMDRNEALIEAARLRVRPVLMTAVATIVALLPLAIGISGEGGIISRSLGTVVIGGLITATALTLVIVPAVFTLFDRGRRSPATEPPAPGGSDDDGGDEVSSTPLAAPNGTVAGKA